MPCHTLLIQILISSPSLSTELHAPWRVGSALPPPNAAFCIWKFRSLLELNTSKKKPQILLKSKTSWNLLLKQCPSSELLLSFWLLKAKTLSSQLLPLFLSNIQSITKSCCLYNENISLLLHHYDPGPSYIISVPDYYNLLLNNLPVSALATYSPFLTPVIKVIALK